MPRTTPTLSIKFKQAPSKFTTNPDRPSPWDANIRSAGRDRHENVEDDAPTPEAKQTHPAGLKS